MGMGGGGKKGYSKEKGSRNPKISPCTTILTTQAPLVYAVLDVNGTKNNDCTKTRSYDCDLLNSPFLIG
jgi:hypothetical protein